MNIVFSRPIWSETQPKNGRVSPFNMRSIVAAKVSAGIVIHSTVTGVVGDLEVERDRRKVGGDDQAAGADQDEHEIHQHEDRLALGHDHPAAQQEDQRGECERNVEPGARSPHAEAAHQGDERADDPPRIRTDDLVGRELAAALEDRGLTGDLGDLARFRREHRKGEKADDDALAEAEIEERGLEPTVLDHRDDRHDRQRRAGAEARSRDPCGQTAPTGNHLSALPMHVP